MSNFKVFLVERGRGGYIGFEEDMSMVVVAVDEKHAERKARWHSEDFKKAKGVVVTPIVLDEEKVILTKYKGG